MLNQDSMKHLRLILGIILLQFTTVCYAQNCTTLTQGFTSYAQAVNLVENYSFKISESVNTSSSSWVQSAHYYSCDGKLGYFILYAQGRSYIHQNVPIDLWYQFKNANSFGSFYDENIKGRYRL